MAILLSILKITGIVLLSILALVLVLVLLVLLLPIHYQLWAEFDQAKGCFKAKAKVTYMAYLIHAEADAENSRLSWYLKIFGRKKLESGRDTDEEDDGDQEEPAVAGGAKAENILDEIEQAPEKKEETAISTVPSKESLEESPETVEAGAKAEERAGDKEAEGQDQASGEEDGKRTGLAGRIRGFIDKVKGFIEKIRELCDKTVSRVKNIGYTIQELYDKIRLAFKKVRYYKDLLQLETSKEAISFGWKQLKYLLWHLRPRRLEGYLKMGREDPADTGELLGLICTLRPVYGRHFLVEPDFEREVLEGNFYMKGFFQLYVAVIVLAKCYFNKNFMRFIRRMKRGQNLE